MFSATLFCPHHKPPTYQYTVQCHYNAVNFLENRHTRHPIANPLGPGMGVFCEYKF